MKKLRGKKSGDTHIYLQFLQLLASVNARLMSIADALCVPDAYPLDPYGGTHMHSWA